MKAKLTSEQAAAQKWQAEMKALRSSPGFEEETARMLDLSVFFGRSLTDTDKKWLKVDPPEFVSRRNVYYSKK